MKTDAEMASRESEEDQAIESDIPVLPGGKKDAIRGACRAFGVRYFGYPRGARVTVEGWVSLWTAARRVWL